MRTLAWVVVFGVAAGASAQPGRGKAPAVVVPAPVVDAPPLVERSAPPEEAGWKVVEVPGGYFRYQPDGDAGDPPEVVVVPALPMPEVTRPAAVQESERSRPQASADGCRGERQALAQRVAFLQGLDVDGPTAELLVLDPPRSPHVQRSIFGLPTLVWAPTTLLTAAQVDTPARELAAAWAHCLAR